MKKARPNELAIWKARVAALNRKEARCPGCIKAAKEAVGTNKPAICARHYEIRWRMA